MSRDMIEGGIGAIVSGLHSVTGGAAARLHCNAVARTTAIFALALIPTLGSATIYKCTGREGGITYTDAPCSANETTQYVDPVTRHWTDEPSQTTAANAALPIAMSPSQPDSLAILCANDEFAVWLRAQRHGLPEQDVRWAKYVQLSHLCRKALHLAEVPTSASQTAVNDSLRQER